MACYECGDNGHIRRDCPNLSYVDLGAYPDGTPKTQWCGICDERTRLIIVAATGDTMARCPECHPKRKEQHAQFRRCQSCKVVVFTWDTAECGSHSGPDTPDRRPAKDDIREITHSATMIGSSA